MSKPLLHDLGVAGEKLPPHIEDFVQRIISLNIPEKIEVTVGKRVYPLAFYPYTQRRCVNFYGLDLSDRMNFEENFRKLKLGRGVNWNLLISLIPKRFSPLWTIFIKLLTLP